MNEPQQQLLIRIRRIDTWGAASKASNAWRGVPLFSAWITEPIDADEEPADQWTDDEDFDEIEDFPPRAWPVTPGILDRLRGLFRRSVGGR